MSVNAVSGASLRQDLVSALRQARAASTPQLDASAFTTASQDTEASQSTSSSGQTTGSSAAPALSSDLMASLLQLQSDFSQMGLQTGITSPTDSDDAASTTGAADASQASNGAAPVHHHHGHHARPPETDASDDAQAGQSATAADGAASSASASVQGSSGSDLGDGLQSLLQQVTKAIAAYATAGPVGIAAAALTISSKA